MQYAASVSIAGSTGTLLQAYRFPPVNQASSVADLCYYALASISLCCWDKQSPAAGQHGLHAPLILQPSHPCPLCCHLFFLSLAFYVANLQSLERIFEAKERKEARIAERKAEKAAQQKAAKQADRLRRKQEAQMAATLKAEQEAERRQLKRDRQDKSRAAAAGLYSASCLQTNHLDRLSAPDALPTANRLVSKTGLFACTGSS